MSEQTGGKNHVLLTKDLKMAALGDLCTFLAKQGSLKYKIVVVAYGKFINQLLI